MIGLLIATTISCTESVRIVNRLANVIGLSYKQKIELIQVINQHTSSCSLNISQDERPESSN